MYVKINRNVCGHQIATCERCLGQFLKYPYGYERQCFEVIEEDGNDYLTLDITSGENQLHLVLSEATRQMMAGEGWAKILEEAGVL